MIVRLLSQGIILHNPPSTLLHYLEGMVHSRLIAPKLKREGRGFVTEDGDRYFYIDKAANDYYYHISQLENLKSAINLAQGKGQLGKVTYVKEPVSSGVDVKFKNYKFDMVVPDDNPKVYEMYGFQNEVTEKAMEPGRRQTIFAIQTGRGKMSVLSEPLLTPNGWKLMGDIEVGDVVIGRDGKATEVTGVFPQPNGLDTYEVTTYDGRKHRVGKEHLWYCFYNNTTMDLQWGVRDTGDIIRLLSLPDSKVYIPAPEPVEFAPLSEPLPINPYMLGVLIGDGILATAYNMLSKETSAILTKLGLSGKKSWEKFIPEVYLLGTVEDRWKLLRGLMDADGYVDYRYRKPIYVTDSERLAKQVQELAWSLGGLATLEKVKGIRDSYNVTFVFKNPSMLFRMGRKKKLTRGVEEVKVRIKSINKVESEPMQCITVAAKDSLYVAKDYIVTHNTKSFQKVMVKKSKRTCIIVRPAYKDKWRNDCVTDKTGLYEPSARVRVATGVDGINLLIDDAKNGRLDRMNISTIIIPTTSLKLWLEWHSSSVSINRINLWEFYSILGVGNVGYDEIHEHFHTVYLAGMILNPPPTVEMSATLVPSKSKEFIRQRYLERFPLKYRLTIPVIRICKVGFFYYSIMVNKFLHRVDRMAMYNHKTFEDYLYQHSMLEDYFDMVYSIMVNGYLNSYQDGQRAIVFFSLVQTCTDFTEYVKRRLSEEDRPKLNVVRYVADDKYDDLMKADVAISTPGKAGTAIDLPGLVLALVTTAIDDRQLNEQIAGRPRKPTKWEMDPLVIFTHCRELTKHNRYLNSRMEALNLVAKKLSVVDTSYKINGIEKPNVHLSPTKSDIGTNTERGKQLKVLEKFKRRVAKKQRFDKRQRRKNFKRGRRG